MTAWPKTVRVVGRTVSLPPVEPNYADVHFAGTGVFEVMPVHNFRSPERYTSDESLSTASFVDGSDGEGDAAGRQADSPGAGKDVLSVSGETFCRESPLAPHLLFADTEKIRCQQSKAKWR